jgi:EAL domain-containing protein (putative c-di-GMP-specific phosphodiesterase class I)/GGDEF domain-containing protein
VTEQARSLLEARSLRVVFQPIFSFGDARMLGCEALVRGPAGSSLEAPLDLFRAAQQEGVVVELNIVCLQEILRAFAHRGIAGDLFVNVSPQLIVQPGFSQERASRFLQAIGIVPERVVIELTEDYPTFDFALVQESLRLYRAMGFRVAIDDLGEGFASLRLWSELRPEFVKADKHFVSGIAHDALKLQFLRAIQHIGAASGARVVAEGIENADDFRLARDLGIACAQGWFIGRPAEVPNPSLPAQAAAANDDGRVPVMPHVRMHAVSRSRAGDFARRVEPASGATGVAELRARFERFRGLDAIPMVEGDSVAGLVSRCRIEALRGDEDCACEAVIDDAPLRVEADLDLDALTALVLEADGRRLADGFVILERGRYLGMGRSGDVLRALQGAHVRAARYTHPLSVLPGQVPIDEHLDRLLRAQVSFVVWIVQIEEMHAFNDAEGFEGGDRLIQASARLLESLCEPGTDLVGHVAGTRFVLLLQSDDWRLRARRAIAAFPRVLEAHASREVFERGYFCLAGRDGRSQVRPLPRLTLGAVPVLPGVFESRHEVLAEAKRANRAAARGPASALYIDERRANAYPQSLLLEPQ